MGLSGAALCEVVRDGQETSVTGTETARYSQVLDYCVAKTRENLARLDAFPHTRNRVFEIDVPVTICKYTFQEFNLGQPSVPLRGLRESLRVPSDGDGRCR